MTQHGNLLPKSLLKPALGHMCSSKPDHHAELPSEAVPTSGTLSKG